MSVPYMSYSPHHLAIFPTSQNTTDFLMLLSAWHSYYYYYDSIVNIIIIMIETDIIRMVAILSLSIPPSLILIIVSVDSPTLCTNWYAESFRGMFSFSSFGN